jgi:subfamily B ATP-binding cassette protein HlyB/CyaB
MQGVLTRENFVWLAGSLCQLNRVPFDPGLLLQRFPAPHSVGQFIEAARALGLRTGEARLARGDLKSLREPCVGFLKAPASKPAILFKSDGSRLLYFEAGEQNPKTAPLDAPMARPPPGASASAGSGPSCCATAPCGATCSRPRSSSS